MTLRKAIELLQLDLNDPGSVPIKDLNQAQKLGIEALKRLQEERKHLETAFTGLLPGETKD